MFEILPASRHLAGLVTGYWFVEDLAGEHRHRPVATAPVAGAILTVNLGRSNAMVGGPVVPRVALTGVQTVGRNWQSCTDTYFVMAMLTLPGLARLFPGAGEWAADTVLDVGALVGDGPARALDAAVSAAWEPRRIAGCVDAWLTSRLARTPVPLEPGRYAAACGMLAAGEPVEAAARHAAITRRQLHRWTRSHAGVSPKQLADIARLQASLGALQSRRGDPLQGYSDQAHQIRSWKRRLGITPGAYAAQERSVLAESFGRHRADDPEGALPFYL
ncbi:MAG TPA: helix-turn-helix domain-containing protein [Azospirillaceae bacterium]|nr:helix-turn-helix domain-containing protein [Azospirillaceae bacterium]